MKKIFIILSFILSINLISACTEKIKTEELYLESESLHYEGELLGEMTHGYVYEKSGDLMGYTAHSPITIIGKWNAIDLQNHKTSDFEFLDNGILNNNSRKVGTYNLHINQSQKSKVDIEIKYDNMKKTITGSIEFLTSKNAFVLLSDSGDEYVFIRDVVDRNHDKILDSLLFPPKLDNDIIYEDGIYGFKLKIPELWKDYYIIQRGNWIDGVDGTIDFNFKVDDMVFSNIFSIIILNESISREEWDHPFWTYILESEGKTFAYTQVMEPSIELLKDENKEKLNKLIGMVEEIPKMLETFRVGD